MLLFNYYKACKIRTDWAGIDKAQVINYLKQIMQAEDDYREINK